MKAFPTDSLNHKFLPMRAKELVLFARRQLAGGVKLPVVSRKGSLDRYDMLEPSRSDGFDRTDIFFECIQRSAVFQQRHP